RFVRCRRARAGCEGRDHHRGTDRPCDIRRSTRHRSAASYRELPGTRFNTDYLLGQSRSNCPWRGNHKSLGHHLSGNVASCLLTSVTLLFKSSDSHSLHSGGQSESCWGDRAGTGTCFFSAKPRLVNTGTSKNSPTEVVMKKLTLLRTR